jgi:hypothetical protein
MDEIETKLFLKVISTLKTLNLKYAIIDAHGFKHGDLDVVAKKPRKKRDETWGEMAGYLRPFIEDLQPATKVAIPGKHYELISLQAAALSLLGKMHGYGRASSHVDRTKNVLFVLRSDGELLL